jgi:hypothetical protein
VYDREIDGQEHTFGVSGKLIMNVLVMYDRQTETLWSQLIGEAVEGPLKGTKLDYVESLQTTWAEWKELYPDTVALRKSFAGARDAYDSYYESNRAGVLGEFNNDDRLNTKQFVVGVALGDGAKAYPFSKLNDEPVVNDELNGQPLLVVFDPDSATGAVFGRDVDGQILTFELDVADGLDGTRLVDEQTGTIWSAFTGLALEGPLAGTELERVRSTSSFWFGWKDFHPDTKVYAVDG